MEEGTLDISTLKLQSDPTRMDDDENVSNICSVEKEVLLRGITNVLQSTTKSSMFLQINPLLSFFLSLEILLISQKYFPFDIICTSFEA